MRTTSNALRELIETSGLVEHPVLLRLPAQLAALEDELARVQGPEPLGDISADLFVSGGKRLRAVLAFTVADALDVPPKLALAIASAVEATHGASLLHDDVIDEADERRARPAARKRWCNTLSVLGGDHLLLTGLRRIADLGSPALLEAHLSTLESVLASEVAQHRARETWDTSVEGYLGVARGKTGSLFAHACSGPAVLAGDEARAASLARFGEDLGVAFQILDDVRDVLGRDPTKPAAQDLREGILSMPLCLAVHADPTLDATLRRAARFGLPEDELERSLARVRATGAVEKAAARAGDHLASAQAALDRVGHAESLALLGAICRGLAGEARELAENTQ